MQKFLDIATTTLEVITMLTVTLALGLAWYSINEVMTFLNESPLVKAFTN